jgi:hypothetical protein
MFVNITLPVIVTAVAVLHDRTAYSNLAENAFDEIYLRIKMTYCSAVCFRCGYSVGNCYLVSYTQCIALSTTHVNHQMNITALQPKKPPFLLSVFL